MSLAIEFAAPKSDTSTLTLPAGFVQSSEGGRICSIAGWIVAVAISPSVYIVAQPRLQPTGFSTLLEQLVGFLVGRGAEVLRMDVRFPESWHKSGKHEATVRFWVEHFLNWGRERRLFVALPPRLVPSITLPLSTAAESAEGFWQEVHTLMDALSSEYPETLVRMSIPLWNLARDWETQWNAVQEAVERHGAMSPDDRELIDAANRTWANVVTEHLEPVRYAMKPETIARLL